MVDLTVSGERHALDIDPSCLWEPKTLRTDKTGVAAARGLRH